MLIENFTDYFIRKPPKTRRSQLLLIYQVYAILIIKRFMISTKMNLNVKFYSSKIYFTLKKRLSIRIFFIYRFQLLFLENKPFMIQLIRSTNRKSIVNCVCSTTVFIIFNCSFGSGINLSL